MSQPPKPPAREERMRRIGGPLRWVVRAVSIALSVYILAYVSTLLDFAGVHLYGAHRALAFSGIIFLLFLLYPATPNGPWDRVPWYDFLLAAAGVVTSQYAFFSWEAWIYGVSVPTGKEEVLGIVLVVVVLEAARRVLGLTFALVGLAFALYPIAGPYLPGILVTNPYSLSQLTQFFYLSGGGSGVFGTPMEIFTTTVSMFLLFGAFLSVSGASEVFLHTALALAGRFRAGMAKVAVVASSLFATISGVGAANVLVTGSFTIPAMLRLGYRPAFAAAVESAASTGGIIMPPVMGAAAFLMADILAVSYWSICKAAFLPALLYYIAIYTSVDAEGAKRGLGSVEEAEIPKLAPTLARGWFLFGAIAVLLVLLGYWSYPVDQSAVVAIAVLCALAALRRDGLRFSGLVRALEDGGRLMAQIGAAGAVIGIIMSGFSLTGLGALLPTAMGSLAGNSLLALLVLAAAASVILGMGAPPLLVYVLLAATAAPALIKLGVAPLSAHLFIFYYGMLSMITPPVALCNLIAARVANANFWATSVEAVRLGIVAFVVPFFFVYQPALLLMGDAAQVALAVVTSVTGAFAISGGLAGFLFVRRLALWESVALCAAGLLLIFPGKVTDLIGAVLLAPTAALILVHLYRRRAEASVSGTGP